MNIGYVCLKNQISKTELGSFTSLLRQFYFHYSRYHVMKTGRKRSLKGTYCDLRSCNGRGRPFSTWVIRNTFHWCTSATYTHRSGYRLQIESGVHVILVLNITSFKQLDRLLQGPQERLLVLFPFDLLILSLDCHHVRVKYEVS